MKVNIIKSDKPEKRMKAIFTQDNKKIKTIHFGSSKGKAFIDHKDEKIKEAWIARFSKIKGTNYNDPVKASTLAKEILWNKPTLKASIEDYKKKFNL